MKKLFLCCAVLSLCLLLCACTSEVQKADEITNTKDNTSMFVQIESTNRWIIVYHKETYVMYAVSAGNYNGGTFTLLVNADGTPMIYGGQ